MWAALNSAWNRAVVQAHQAAVPSRLAPLGTLVTSPPDWLNLKVDVSIRGPSGVHHSSQPLGWGRGRQQVKPVGDGDGDSSSAEEGTVSIHPSFSLCRDVPSPRASSGPFRISLPPP